MPSRRQFISAALAVPVLSYLNVLPVHANPLKKTLIVALRLDDATSFDPHEAFDMSNMEVCSNVYQRLLRPNPEQPEQLVGELAQSWSYNDAATEYTFQLKDKQVFADGTPITAEDVVYSLHRVIRLNKGSSFILSQFGFDASNVETLITAPNPLTVFIKLPSATSPSLFLNCISSIAGSVVNKKVVEQYVKDGDFANPWLSYNSAGSGPFVLQQWKTQESVTLVVNPRFPSPINIEKIFIKHVPAPSTQLLLLQKGDIDIARNLDSEQIKRLQNDPSVTVVPVGRAFINLLSLNQKNQYLKHPKVWEAFKYAIDYEGIQKNVLSLTHTVNQVFLPQGFPAAISYNPYTQNIEKAKQLLVEAGYPDGFDLTLDHTSTPLFNDLAQVLQANLAKVGIRIKLQSAEGRVVSSKFRAREHDIVLSNWGSDYFDPNTNAQVFCINLDNSDEAKDRPFAWRSSFQDETLSKLAIAARDEKNQAKRWAMYDDLQRRFVHNSPFVIMFQVKHTHAVVKNVQGYTLGAMPDFSFYQHVVKT